MLISDSLGDILHSTAAVDGPQLTARWEPDRFELSRDADQEALAAILASGRVTRAYDTIRDQVADLLRARSPWLSKQEATRAVDDHLDKTPSWAYGTWFFYPWSGRLIHTLSKDEFRELRSDRNLYKVTAAEQARLREASVGVIGLSVGASIALTLALEGIGTELRLADPDHLDLSNLNRLRSDLHDIGKNKAVLAARAISEIDPYLTVKVFTDGLTEENAAEFLGKRESGVRKLDLVFEECDDFFMKVRVREMARELGIPLVMSTDDRGLIDIERFDRQPDRPLFHGVAGELVAEQLRGLNSQEKIPYVLRILGEEALSHRLAASLVEIDETISSFPQLGSEATLGGALSANVARRILLGELNESGRFYVDIDQLIVDGGGIELPEEAAPLGIRVAEEARREALAPSLRAAKREPDEQEIRGIVGYGILAPSGHNGQPWRFVYRKGVLRCIHDVERSLTVLDHGNNAGFLTIGAAVENMTLAAKATGLETDVQPFPDANDGRVVAELRFTRRRGTPKTPRLLPYVTKRCTNRRLGVRTPLPDEAREALTRAVESAGCHLQLITDEERLRAVGVLAGEGDRVAYLFKPLHAELMHGMRWSPEHALATRDGIDVATLELTNADAAGLKLLSHWGSMRFIATIGGGRVLENISKKAVGAASAVGLITVEGLTPSAFFQGGRATQRAWLETEACGLSFQPLAMLPYLFYRLERGGADLYGERQRSQLTEMRARYRAIFDVPEGHAEPMLFRISAPPGPPTARALRRPIDEVLDIL